MKKALITGSSGLIGSEVCVDFDRRGFEVHGVDNNQRAVFFGPSGDTRWNQQRLESRLHEFPCITSWTCAIAKACWRWWRTCGPT